MIYDLKLMLIDMLRWKGTSTFSFDFLGLRDTPFDPLKFAIPERLETTVSCLCCVSFPVLLWVRVCLSLLFADSVQFFSAFSHCLNAHLESSLVFCLAVLVGPPCTVNPGLHSLPTCHTLATTAKTATQVTQVYDDATDWYSEAANPWLSEKQREEVRPIFLKMGKILVMFTGLEATLLNH